MPVVTVTGPIPSQIVGSTLMHEHLFMDGRPLRGDYRPVGGELPIRIETFGALLRNPMRSSDNLVLADHEVAEAELTLFKRSGGGTVVDTTPPELGRDPVKLRRLSGETGVSLVMGTGLALESPSGRGPTEPISGKELESRILRETTEGVSDTEIRPGVIGEIRVPMALTAHWEALLESLAHAQNETGLCLVLVPERLARGDRISLATLDILENHGADLARVVVGGLSSTLSDSAYHKNLLERGVVLLFDELGAEFYFEGFGVWENPLDIEIADTVASLIQAGWSEQILLSHATYYRTQLSVFGGWGYSYIASHIFRFLTRRGVSASQLQQITKATPARLLTVDGKR
jgi:phosphotriesterase-related protein